MDLDSSLTAFDFWSALCCSFSLLFIEPVVRSAHSTLEGGRVTPANLEPIHKQAFHLVVSEFRA